MGVAITSAGGSQVGGGTVRRGPQETEARAEEGKRQTGGRTQAAAMVTGRGLGRVELSMWVVLCGAVRCGAVRCEAMGCVELNASGRGAKQADKADKEQRRWMRRAEDGVQVTAMTGTRGGEGGRKSLSHAAKLG